MKFAKVALVALTALAFTASACDKKEDAKKEDAKKDEKKDDARRKRPSSLEPLVRPKRALSLGRVPVSPFRRATDRSRADAARSGMLSGGDGGHAGVGAAPTFEISGPMY